MPIVPGQIHFLEMPRLRKSNYGHPCLVLDVKSGKTQICWISTQFELRESDDYTINALDEGFRATGLKETSYLVQAQIAWIESSYLKDAKLLGHVSESIKTQIENWYGGKL